MAKDVRASLHDGCHEAAWTAPLLRKRADAVRPQELLEPRHSAHGLHRAARACRHVILVAAVVSAPAVRAGESDKEHFVLSERRAVDRMATS
jgi:hypothetical protein